MDAQVSQVLELMISDLARQPNIMAIIAEPLPNREAVHITTFVYPMNEETRDAVYEVEMKVIDQFKSMAFDFHLREAKMHDAQIVIPAILNAHVRWQRPS